jgi:hypothetical protein
VTKEPDVSTEILPATPPTEPAADPSASPKKKRRGWIIALVIVGVLLVLGVVAFVVADLVAKSYARDYVRAQVIEVLKLPEDSRVDVDLGGGSILLQALAGRVQTVDVDVPDVALGTLSGDLSLHGEGVPLDSMKPVETLGIEFGIGADDLAALGGGGEDAPVYAFDGEDVTLSSDFELFGATVPWGLSLTPSAEAGDLVLTPTSLTLGSQTFEADDSDDSFWGQIVDALLQPQTLCLKSSVPQALTLAEASVENEQVLLRFDGSGQALGGEAFQAPGTCPAS